MYLLISFWELKLLLEVKYESCIGKLVEGKYDDEGELEDADIDLAQPTSSARMRQYIKCPDRSFLIVFKKMALKRGKRRSKIN